MKLWEGNISSRVCMSVQDVPVQGLSSLDMLKPVQLEPHCKSPLRHVQTCSLKSTDCRQTGSWHSTEMPSCLQLSLPLQENSMIGETTSEGGLTSSCSGIVKRTGERCQALRNKPFVLMSHFASHGRCLWTLANIVCGTFSSQLHQVQNF